MTKTRLTGLIAATYTPMRADGTVHLQAIQPMVDFLVSRQIDGLYVCGSTGEGVSLTQQERTDVAAAYVAAAQRVGLPVVVQVGHNSLATACELARHADSIGANAISANAPSYFKVTDAATLVSCMQTIANATPDLGFYYYHIPHLTGANLDMLEFLELAADRIPNLVGVKFTAPTVHQYQECLRWNDGHHDVLWGSDEMLLAALSVGAQGAVGSTYNLAAPLYQRIIAAFDAQQIDLARELMAQAVSMIRIIYQYPFHSAAKAVLGMLGMECGNCRLPQMAIADEDKAKLRAELEAIGFSVGRNHRREYRMLQRITGLVVLWLLTGTALAELQLDWSEVPAIPAELGVAGPVVGHHQGRMIVAGGANFPQPVWETTKQWHDDIYVMSKDGAGYTWKSAGKLPRNLGYPACVSTEQGVLVMGGNDEQNVFSDVFMLSWKEGEIQVVEFPPLPKPCVHGSAALIDGHVYLVGGQSGGQLETAMNHCWRMELKKDPAQSRWEELPAIPHKRALHITVAQHNGYEVCLYVISGRAQNGTKVEFLKDVWEYSPSKERWRQRTDAPACVMAGTGIAFGNNHLFVLGGDDGEFFTRADELKDDHPGFPKRSYAYHTVTDRWLEAGPIPANHVTTQAIDFDGQIMIPSGEVRPRVRSPKVWSVQVKPTKSSFGVVNYVVLFGYLAAMVGVGLYFARKNKNTDDYFRGGSHIPWWAAGCSIYATMLSSLTYTGIPSLSFQQDWVIAVLNFTIPIVAFIAIGVALPFFRRIDATSAYEYLERRFNYSVRLFGSLSFTLFHIFRMAIVLALTGLALDVATPLSPKESVLLMGVLSIIYCTVGGIEAVIWTDTIQTVVLLGGALVAGAFLLSGVDGGVAGYLAAGEAENKFNWAHFNFDLESAQVAIWFIVIGGIAQNISSYTADQAVVQRYMTTETEQLAARSIWTNAILAIPTTLLFFGIGTALYAFYQSHPERMDPTITPDQIFPLFIAHELPVGIAGLIVAGIFAAAQSTVSTSMNSMATTTVTDFLRPMGVFRSEEAYLRSAQIITLVFGIAGTAVALVFIDPNILRRFEAFIKVVGLFMGVLGGLFVLGALTRKANAPGTLFGAFVGAAVMIFIWKFTDVTSYMYTFFGITSCAVAGYLASLVIPHAEKDLTGLTIYTLNDAPSN